MEDPERQRRHDRANAEAAVNLLRKALTRDDLSPEKRQHVQTLLAQAEARMQAIGNE